jgi:cellulose synthase (UDP-forming)
VAWFTQQFKWARGVFEVLLTTMPRLWSRLTWGQRLSYSVRTTKYLIGPFIFIHLASLIGGLLSGQEQVLKSLTEYYLCLAPLMLMDMIIRHLALRKWHHPSLITTSLWRAVILVYATWPIYTLAWLMSILRLPLAFRPTPKNNTNGINPLWLLPQLISVILLEIGLFISLNIMGQNPRYFLLLGAVICFIIPQIGLVRPLLRSIFRFGKRQLTRPGIALPGSLTRENSSHNSR